VQQVNWWSSCRPEQQVAGRAFMLARALLAANPDRIDGRIYINFIVWPVSLSRKASSYHCDCPSVRRVLLV